MVEAPTGANADLSWALGVNSLIEGQLSQSISPPQTIKGVRNVRNRLCIFAGDGVDAPIVNLKPV